MKYNKETWELEVTKHFTIQFNWVVGGAAIAIDYDYDRYTIGLTFKFIKPVISFWYIRKTE